MNAQVTPCGRPLGGRTSGGRGSCRAAVRSRKAFTLVELLVVITIIGILIALLIPAVGIVMRNARNAQISLEINGLASALEAYKLEMGDYPPDFALVGGNMLNPQVGTDAQQVSNHLARKYRRRNKQADAIAPAQLEGLDPSEALVFWLSGVSDDPMRPLTSRKAYDAFPAKVRGATPFFEFDQSRLQDKDNDGWPEYYPPANVTAPYVYLLHTNYVNPNNPQEPHQILNGTGQVRAYGTQLEGMAVSKYAEPEKFQIISSGLDNKFIKPGSPNSIYPDGLGYQEEDEDNLTNFSEGKTLQAAMP